ncbi:MAG: ATP-grasp domain-containing protein [Bacteroides sp.]|nr:ATP-grasp domain-containing protein [Bacteroides sp.]
MIWSVVSKAEMEGSPISPVFKYYKEVLGKNNISLAVIDEKDPLDFVKNGDVVFLRDTYKSIIDTIHKRGFVSTAEKYEQYRLVGDKFELWRKLEKHNIPMPSQITFNDICDGDRYFVKPRHGTDSLGIDEHNICSSVSEVMCQIKKISELLNDDSVIEEYIDGIDCTVACYRTPNPSIIKCHPIEVHCDTIGGVQTYKGKFDCDEYCCVPDSHTANRLIDICKIIFEVLGISHYARIDFRKKSNGEVYLIDINLLPGPGPVDHFAKCLLLTENISYRDSMLAMINSASI